MSEVAVAKRYAEALFQLAKDNHTSDNLVEEFQMVKNLFLKHNELNPFFDNPAITIEQKKQFVSDVFGDFSKTVTNTLKLLVERHRIDIVGDMADLLKDQVNENQKVAEATVYTVRELSQEALGNLETTLAKRYDKQSITFTTVVDTSLIGGIKIRIGNTIIDGSISSQLARIERNMKLANN